MVGMLKTLGSAAYRGLKAAAATTIESACIIETEIVPLRPLFGRLLVSSPSADSVTDTGCVTMVQRTCSNSTQHRPIQILRRDPNTQVDRNRHFRLRTLRNGPELWS
nr:hypothetical protein CFP56_25903 [Quercus suber]